MLQSKHKYKNNLILYRRRMGYSQKRVANLLGHRDASVLCVYEHGHKHPPLATALSLGIILRVPVEFLFPTLYDELRDHIREQESRYSGGQEAGSTLKITK